MEDRHGPVGDSLRDWLWLCRFRLRARFERRFGVPAALDPAGTPLPDRPAAPALPRRVWIYWEQGWDEAPELVRRCRRSWEERNPGWEVVALDAASAAAWVPAVAEIGWRGMRRNHRANFLRMDLLAGHGGVWADATVFCSVPLDAWLPPLTATGFFAFARPGKDRLLSTWLLAARPEHPLLLAWRAACRRYARLTRGADFYFWFPYLFADLCRSDAAALRIWKGTPYVGADLSHGVQWSVARPEGAEAIAAHIAAGTIPVHKLDWRLDPSGAEPGTPLALLLEA